MFWLSWQWWFSSINFEFATLFETWHFFGRENAQIPKDRFYFWEWDAFRLGWPGYLGMFSLQCNPSSRKILSGHFTVCRQNGPSQWHQQHRTGQAAITLQGLRYWQSWEFVTLGYICFILKKSIFTTWLQRTPHIFVGLLASTLTQPRDITEDYKSHTFVPAQ